MRLNRLVRLLHPLLRSEEANLLLVLTFRRSDLQAVLVEHLHTADKIFYSKRLAAYVEPKDGSLDPIVLHFKDGTTSTCDLLVGSDGIRSAVRRTMFSDLADTAKNNGNIEQAAKLRMMIDPVWSGQVAYRGVVPVDKLEGSAFTDIDKPIIVRVARASTTFLVLTSLMTVYWQEQGVFTILLMLFST